MLMLKSRTFLRMVGEYGYEPVLAKLSNLHLRFILHIESTTGSDWLPFPKQALFFTCLQYQTFENTVGKGEIARNEQFLLFPQCFLRFQGTFHHFHQT